jgi:hypothetical protein
MTGASSARSRAVTMHREQESHALDEAPILTKADPAPLPLEASGALATAEKGALAAVERILPRAAPRRTDVEKAVDELWTIYRPSIDQPRLPGLAGERFQLFEHLPT